MKNVWFLPFFLLLACQGGSPPPADALHGDLYVRYLQDGRQIKAEASFLLQQPDSTWVPYPVEGGVAFRGSGMGSRNLAGQMIRYQYENKSDYPELLSFQMTDQQGKNRTFEQTMIGVDSFQVAGPISISQGATIQLFPTGLTEQQQLVLLFSDTSGKAFTTLLNGPSSGNTLAIPAAGLEKMTPGNYELYLVKKQVVLESEAAFSYVFSVEYYTDTQTVTLTD